MPGDLTLLDAGIPLGRANDDGTVDYSFDPRFTSSALPGWLIEVRARVIAGRLIITSIGLDSGSSDSRVRAQRDAFGGDGASWWPGRGAVTGSVLSKVSVPAILSAVQALVAGTAGAAPEGSADAHDAAWQELRRERWLQLGSAVAAATAAAAPHTKRSGGRPKARSDADHERTVETILRLQAEGHRDYKRRAAAELGRLPESFRHDIADAEHAGYLLPGPKNHRQPGPALLRRRAERGARR